MSERRGDEKALPAYDAQIEIDERIIEQARDTFDYRRPLPGKDVDAFLATL